MAVLNTEIAPGEVQVLHLPIWKRSGTVEVFCKDKKFKYYNNGRHFVVYLSESYFSDMKPYDCFYEVYSLGKEFKYKYKVARIKIKKKKFKQEYLRVQKRKIDLAKKDIDRVIEEKKQLEKVYTSSSGYPLFFEDFILPLNSKITSPYGIRRIYNDKKRSQHLGTDFRARMKTKIYSTNRGRVVFAGNLFFTGNTVILDHGMDIYTIYAHLSRIKIKVGREVRKGELLALSGNTGRTSGPHLHWGVKVNGNWVDGFSLKTATQQI
jgi:murein DD-endopeptidase MepM/ murein hydrolase activator NlpD